MLKHKVSKKGLNILLSILLGIIPIIISVINLLKTGSIPIKTISLISYPDLEYYLIYESICIFIFSFMLLETINEVKKMKGQGIESTAILIIILFFILGLVASICYLHTKSEIGPIICLLIPTIIGISIIILMKAMENGVSTLLGISAGLGSGIVLSFKESNFIFIPLLCLFFSIVFIITINFQIAIINLKLK
jgi:hypothetical protein